MHCAAAAAAAAAVVVVVVVVVVIVHGWQGSVTDDRDALSEQDGDELALAVL
jgi:Tfp pilus assembly protein PilO